MFTFDLDDFATRALIGGLGIALSTGLLGCFIVWKKMSYLGDSLAHSSLLGIVIGIALNINPMLSITLYGLFFAISLMLLQRSKLLATDTLIGVLGHASLAIGIVSISLSSLNTVSLHSYLLGDILTITQTELLYIYGGAMLIWGLVILFWSPLLLSTVSEDLAQAERLKTFWLNALMILLIAILVAFSIRIIGILLMTALLIIPAATARHLSKTPESMVFFSVILSLLSIVLGIVSSFYIDVPTGPAIVTIAVIQFAVILMVHSQRLLKS